jgi:hypothetical protein
MSNESHQHPGQGRQQPFGTPRLRHRLAPVAILGRGSFTAGSAATSGLLGIGAGSKRSQSSKRRRAAGVSIATEVIVFSDRLCWLLRALAAHAVSNSRQSGFPADQIMMNAPIRDIPVDGRQGQTALDVARGTRRLLRLQGFASITELVLADGRRADIVGLGRDGEILIVEIKSSLADLRADNKWPHYRAFCDRLYFAIPPFLPAEALPADAGLIVADAFGADMLREAAPRRLPGPTRRAMLIRFAQAAALRLQGLSDPEGPS